MGKRNSLPYVIVAEDDLVWSAPGAWHYYLSQMPKDFDVYLGMFYVGEKDEGNRLASICSGFTLYTISQRFYDVFLSIPQDSHIDREVTRLHKDYKMYVVDKYVCWQQNGYSDNTLKHCDFTPYHEKMNLYNGE